MSSGHEIKRFWNSRQIEWIRRSDWTSDDRIGVKRFIDHP